MIAEKQRAGENVINDSGQLGEVDLLLSADVM
jgi:hypothetical protein